MPSVSKNNETSKKARTDQRILAQAQQEQREDAPESTELAELQVLRELAGAVVGIYDCGGEGKLTSEGVLREALRTVRADLDLFGDSSCNGLGGPDSMAFIRVQRRIDLALALSEYHASFGANDAGADEEAVAS